MGQVLTPKQLSIFFQNVKSIFLYCSLQLQYFCFNLFKYHECLVSTVESDGLVI